MTPLPERDYIITEAQLQAVSWALGGLSKNNQLINEIRSRPTTASAHIPLPNSSDLLLIAHDEWKRREERKHLHENIPWVHGWISGFLTSRKFVQDRIKELHMQEERQ